MKRLLVIMAILLIPCVACSAPYLVCDPQTGITHYKVTGPSWVVSPVPAQADGSIRMDVSGAVSGTNSLTVSACKADLIWNEVCSTAVPFSFTKPSPPITPSNLKLQ